MDVRAKRVAEEHDGLLPWWALRDAGLTCQQARRAVEGLRRMHDGVHLTGQGRIGRHQRHLAATLTTRESVLSHASGADRHGFRSWHGPFEVITRPGSGGPRRIGDLLVLRSSTLEGHVGRRDGIRVTGAARTIVDLSPHLSEPQRAKAVREAIRLRTTTALELRLVVAQHPRRRGIAGLAALAARLEALPLGRTRSDAEARALEVLLTARRVIPDVNVVIAGLEADLSWPASRRILEIDGPQFHQDPVEDARRTAVWTAAGWEVHRVSSSVVFDEPHVLVALAARLERPRTAT